MQKTKTARIVWTILFVVWLAFVWGHSLASADISSMESSRFVFLVRPIFELFGNSDERAMTFVIRKAAHFSEYVVLTFLASGCARAWFAQSAACARAVLAVWIMTPLIDETIQGFVPGRDPRVMDVCIDLAGGLLGMLIARKTLRRGDAKLRGNC